MLRLSQGLLNLFTSCPRKFQHLYLEQISAPLGLTQQERLSWGERFHLLMQQQELGLPILSAERELSSDEQSLLRLARTFVQSVPELFQTGPDRSRQSEHQRTLEFRGYLLTVIYDLLILEEQQAQILDWKTYSRPAQLDWLYQNWQTRLYPFVLVESSEYTPEQVSMTYWFVQTQSGQTPQSLKCAYNTALHRQTHQDLVALLDRLTDYLHRYQQGESFPQVELASTECDTCAFAIRCQRDPTGQTTFLKPIVTLEEIPEIAL
jgi:hypothetical protein